MREDLSCWMGVLEKNQIQVIDIPVGYWMGVLKKNQIRVIEIAVVEWHSETKNWKENPSEGFQFLNGILWKKIRVRDFSWWVGWILCVCVCAVEGNQRGHILFLLQQACWRSRYTLWSWSEIGHHSDCSNTSSNNNYNESDDWDWSSELLAAEICSFNDHGKSCSCTHNCSRFSSSSCSCGSPGSCCCSSSSCCTSTGSYSRTHLNSTSV